MDFSKPLTKVDLELLTRISQSMPSYKDESISVTDIPKFHQHEKVRHVRTPEQEEAYKKYVDKYLGGRVPLKLLLAGFEAMHDTSGFMKIVVDNADKNGDGYICGNEFEEFLDFALTHDPRLKGTTFETFVKEADENKDGKVSVEEFTQWVKISLPPI